VRLISRGGHDWARHFRLIVAGALELRQKHFAIDGEVVVLDKDGVSDFDALRSGKHDQRAQLYAFDVLARDGEDLGALPLALRKAKLARLLSREVEGIFIAEYEQRDFGTIYSAPPARWGLKVSSRSASIAPTVPVDANIG
jgi:bifunctional non-homologous end joining protein LigD